MSRRGAELVRFSQVLALRDTRTGAPIAVCLLDLGLTDSHRCEACVLDQPHELGYRGHAKLLHCAATVDFHCLLRGAPFSGNLLVQHTRDDELHYFELARRQQVKKTTRLVFLGTASSLFRGSNQGVPDALKQLISLKRFPKKIDRAGFHRLRAHRDVAMAGEKYKLFLAGDAGSDLPEARFRLDPASGHRRSRTKDRCVVDAPENRLPIRKPRFCIPRSGAVASDLFAPTRRRRSRRPSCLEGLSKRCSACRKSKMEPRASALTIFCRDRAAM